jgi:hypothetical protein
MILAIALCSFPNAGTLSLIVDDHSKLHHFYEQASLLLAWIRQTPGKARVDFAAISEHQKS